MPPMLRYSRRNENYPIAVGIISILLFLFLLPLFFSSFVLRIFGLPQINGTVFFISRLSYWIGLAFLCLYCFKVEKQSVLIWKDQKYSFPIYAASIVVIFVVLFLGLGVIRLLYSLTHFIKSSEKLAELANLFRQNKFLLIFTALTAGVTEEIIFRGYLQPRIQNIFGSAFSAIFISSVLFGLLHYGYGTLINMIGPFFIGTVFSFYYWKYRNIKVLIICHFLWDLLVLYALLKSRPV
jgi:hypothetical protein